MPLAGALSKERLEIVRVTSFIEAIAVLMRIAVRVHCIGPRHWLCFCVDLCSAISCVVTPCDDCRRQDVEPVSEPATSVPCQNGVDSPAHITVGDFDVPGGVTRCFGVVDEAFEHVFCVNDDLIDVCGWVLMFSVSRRLCFCFLFHYIHVEIGFVAMLTGDG